MKVFICILAFTATVHGGLLPLLEAPLPLPTNSDHSAHQISQSKVIKLIHETALFPHATLPTPQLKILKLIDESAASSENLPVPVAGSSKVIKLNHQSVSQSVPAPAAPPKIVKVIHQSAPVPAPAVARAKLLKVIQEYTPRHYAPAPEVQSSKILKVIKQQTVTPHPAPVLQNVRVYKVYKQIGIEGGLISSLSSSHAAGQTYASNYGHEYSTPASAVKVIRILQKPAHYAPW